MNLLQLGDDILNMDLAVRILVYAGNGEAVITMAAPIDPADPTSAVRHYAGEPKRVLEAWLSKHLENMKYVTAGRGMFRRP